MFLNSIPLKTMTAIKSSIPYNKTLPTGMPVSTPKKNTPMRKVINNAFKSSVLLFGSIKGLQVVIKCVYA